MARSQARWAWASAGAGVGPGTGVVMNFIVIVVPYRSMSVVLWRASPSTENRYNHLSMIAQSISTNASNTKWMKLGKNAKMEPRTGLKEDAGCEGGGGKGGVRQPKVGMHAGWCSEAEGGRERRRATEMRTEP